MKSTTDKTCSICLEVKPFAEFTTDNRARDGHSSRCRDCQRAARSEPEAAFKNYNRRADDDGRAFTLTLDHFRECAGAECTYCGDKLTAPGFDRIDSSGGYTEENVVPCCTQCNLMKNASPEDEYLDKAFKIVANFDPPEATLAELVERLGDDFKRPFEFVAPSGDVYVFEIRLKKVE